MLITYGGRYITSLIGNHLNLLGRSEELFNLKDLESIYFINAIHIGDPWRLGRINKLRFSS